MKSFSQVVMANLYMRMLGSMMGLFLLLSCSVKESRDSCPCLLVLDFRQCAGLVPSEADLLVESSGRTIWKDVVDLSGQSEYSVNVPRSVLHLRVWSHDDGLSTDEGLEIPLGQDCPEVYMHDVDVPTFEETVTDTVLMRKNHCVMHIKTVGGEDFPFDMKVTGNVSGYDRRGNPKRGRFECVPDQGEDCFRVVLPRQTDDTLMLQLEGDGVTCRAFALGQYLLAGGYDWSSPDLEDVTVKVDYALTEIRVVVNGWESVYAYDVIM